MHAGSTAAVCPSLPFSRGPRAAARTAPDLFQACFQGRLLQHMQKERSGVKGHTEGQALSRPELKKHPALLAADRQGAAGRLGRRRPDSPLLRAFEGAVIPPERLPDLAQQLQAAGAPALKAEKFLAQPHIREQGLSVAELKEFLQESGLLKTGDAPGAGGSIGAEEPKLMAALLELVAAAPSGGLKVPPERRPEAQLLLEAAGLTPEQAARLLWHPGAADTGLTAEQVRSQWLKANSPDLGDTTQPEPSGTHAWRQLWQRLSLPAEAWPELKTALQHLGIPPDALVRLEDTYPEGLSLTQVWQLLKDLHGKQDIPKTQEDQVRDLADRLDPDPQVDAQTWARLLRQAGLPEDMVARLWGGASPGSTEDLRERLLKLAPEPEPPPAQESPKPLYLPARLRLGTLPRQFEGEQPPADQGSGNPRFPGNPMPSPASVGQDGAYAVAAQEFLTAAVPFAGPTSPGALATPAGRQAVWAQIENAVLQHLQPGRTQVSLTLNPPELGRVELTLTLQGERLLVQALVSRPEVAHLAQAQVEHLVQALTRQGLFLGQFQVQVPEVPRPLVAAATAGDRAGFRRSEDGPPGNSTSRRQGSQGVDFFA